MHEHNIGCPGFFISALSGGSGKTLVSLGLTATIRGLGKKTAPFKKGPDYIDAGWLSLAAGRPCYNLDTYLIPKERVIQSYLGKTLGESMDIAVVEGNRGLFDGIDLDGKTSTAETAKMLGLPVFLCLDCTKSTRTMAAAVLGCLHFDPDMILAGVILNRVAGPRHQANLTTNIEHHTGVPVLGAIPKLRHQDLPERHMGLVPTFEHEWALESIAHAQTVVQDNINLDQLLDISAEKSCTHIPLDYEEPPVSDPITVSHNRLRIGVMRDAAFQFYYPENIEALEREGASIVYTSPLSDAALPELDALYIGGGFPETHAKQLAENESYRQSVKSFSDQGKPVYAECGGLMYLGRDLSIDGTLYPMTGVFPMSFSISKKPQGHGYVVAEVTRENPFYPVGTIVKGHEFRYSKITDWDEKDTTAFTMQRGTGMKDKMDGIFKHNTFACYTHLHALGTPSWAPAFVRLAEFNKNND